VLNLDNQHANVHIRMVFKFFEHVGECRCSRLWALLWKKIEIMAVR
jgi:hypothetical protein